ncbi:hypothetical protein M406DRAFT_75477 [Cryphonectria parasitica EP155]|uniref:Uncharacterized protein n=1 Tax=Cryphonectria parasitica (strain ATCC 38755 / EP155) TaxID=660469 RepID=A0A9P4Y8F5_CRYP1|nr:uncharacterized protein M406DRAFT_75477 [Cryphonectria parasitica EP155]KAF3768267.1 hypothetical protein M406DRAFT_75477 [Cryphonectria parasitica EP155]
MPAKRKAKASLKASATKPKAQARLNAKAAAEEAAVQRKAAEQAAIAEEKRAERVAIAEERRARDEELAAAREARRAASRRASEQRTAERAADQAAAKAAKAAITKAQTPASPIVIESKDESDNAEQAENLEAIEIATPAEVRIDWHYPPYQRAQFRGIASPEVLTKRFARIVVSRGNTIHRGEKIHCNELIITYIFNLKISSSRYIPHALSRELPPAAASQLAADTQVAIEAKASEFNDLFTPASTTAQALQTPGTARSRSKASNMHKQINAEIASQRNLHKQLNIH